MSHYQQHNEKMLSVVSSKRGVWLLTFGLLVITFFLVNNFHNGGYTHQVVDRLAEAHFSSPTKVLSEHTAASDHTPLPLQHNILDDIKNGTLGFQKIYTISLVSRQDHRDSMSLAASLTGMNITYIDATTSLSDKAMPPGALQNEGFRGGRLYAARSHLTVARTMVENDIQTALIFEDDVDWDVRIKDQLTNFARASQLLLQPMSEEQNKTFLDPTYYGTIPGHNPDTLRVGEHSVITPTTSPYGDVDRWDMLWLGHCGARPPPRDDEFNTPLARAIYEDDTIPLPEHYSAGIGDPIPEEYGPHTRAVFRTGGNVCTLAYGLTLQGARRLLYEFAVKSLDGEFDLSTDAWCRGRDGRPPRICLTAIPMYFGHHLPAGSMAGMSDINEHDEDEGFNEHASSDNIRVGVKVNFDKLVEGSKEYVDAYKERESRGE